MNKTEWTLTEIARILQHPQHRLIYLCEKGVINPDGENASGRGSSRRFSARNLFEFAVALTLWEFHIPFAISGKLLVALRSFQRVLSKSNSNFELPYALILPDAPTIRAVLTHGSCLYFAVGESNDTTLVGGVELKELPKSIAWPNVAGTSSSSKNSIDCLFTRPAGAERAFLELNLTQIAKDLPIQRSTSSLTLVS